MSVVHTLAKLVHRLRVFRDEDTEWLFDLQLDRFESDDDEILGDLFSEDDADELIEVHVSQLDRLARDLMCVSLVFLKPLEPRVGSGFCVLFL
jgi:hypothetical protein